MTRQPERKSDMVRRLLREGEMKQALRIAKGFQYGISREAHMAMQMAYECMVHPEFYRAIGKDIDGIIQSGIEAVNVLYG